MTKLINSGDEWQKDQKQDELFVQWRLVVGNMGPEEYEYFLLCD